MCVTCLSRCPFRESRLASHHCSCPLGWVHHSAWTYSLFLGVCRRHRDWKQSGAILQLMESGDPGSGSSAHASLTSDPLASGGGGGTNGGDIVIPTTDGPLAPLVPVPPSVISLTIVVETLVAAGHWYRAMGLLEAMLQDPAVVVDRMVVSEPGGEYGPWTYPAY